ncbi:MAG TPA: hypothetical protein PLC01_02500 [Methylotenera sp.]|mgnify:CR=1 FL=1|nr:hypothetical protein [Methylotenera sp.]
MMTEFLRDSLPTAVSNDNPLPVVSKKSKRVSVAGLTVTNGAYSAKDVVGGLITFTGALTNGVDTGVLQAISMDLKSAQTGVFVLHLFKSQPSSIADNAVFALSAADALLKVASIPVNWACANGSGSEILSCYLTTGLNIPIESTVGVMYGYLVTDAVLTLTSTSDIASITLGVQCD